MSAEPIDLDTLESLAQAANAKYRSDGWHVVHEGIGTELRDYLAAVPPAVVVALIAELRATRSTIRRAKALAYDPDSADMYTLNAIVVDATALRRVLEGGA